ncbi:hypothetical protein EC991_002573 [Linnemannia zychae]|nr:hypothetical protein EC991_002573 [Linnemannia zychae]
MRSIPNRIFMTSRVHINNSSSIRSKDTSTNRHLFRTGLVRQPSSHLAINLEEWKVVDMEDLEIRRVPHQSNRRLYYTKRSRNNTKHNNSSANRT